MRVPIAYIESDIPAGQTVADWRRSQVRARPARRFAPAVRSLLSARRAR
jgi:hypothetical protein